MASPIPILYSFRRCPYAIRARMAISYTGVQCELREVVLKDKPQEMLDLSPKGTVPVLQLDDRIIDESLDILHWALQQSDPDNWLQPGCNHPLLSDCDDRFKFYLDRYKYADRYPEHDAATYFASGVEYLVELERWLSNNVTRGSFLFGERVSWVDIAIFPFVRQFAFVDKPAFDRLATPRLQTWLDGFLASKLFHSVMHKYPAWQPQDQATIFPGKSKPLS
jgi:glutathione S-transferase